MYTRQHDVKGLSSSYRGPFKILSRPSRSTVIIKVGLNKDGSFCEELRHWSDLKVAHLKDGMAEAERPKRGRPVKVPKAPDASPKDHNASDIIQDSSLRDKNNNIAAIESQGPSPNLDFNIATCDFSIPPPGWNPGNSNVNPALRHRADPTKHTGPPSIPGFPHKPLAWSASSSELSKLNASINKSARGVS